MTDITSLPERAVRVFLNDGLYCSEAILQVYNESLSLGLNEAGLRMATAFGAGLGGSKCLCGSLSGAIMVLSALSGRVSGSEKESELFVKTQQLHDRFREKFRGTCCRVLTKATKWGTPEHHEYCAQFVRGAAETLNELLAADLEKRE
jgi:C_GCAxxG_C_C family probable redox protein